MKKHNYLINSKENLSKDINKKILLVTYDSSTLKYNDKIKFYYALKGRDGKSGIGKLYNINFLGKKVFLLDTIFLEEIKQFFTFWELKYSISKIIILNEQIGELK